MAIITRDVLHKKITINMIIVATGKDCLNDNDLHFIPSTGTDHQTCKEIGARLAATAQDSFTIQTSAGSKERLAVPTFMMESHKLFCI